MSLTEEQDAAKALRSELLELVPDMEPTCIFVNPHYFNGCDFRDKFKCILKAPGHHYSFVASGLYKTAKGFKRKLEIPRIKKCYKEYELRTIYDALAFRTYSYGPSNHLIKKNNVKRYTEGIRFLSCSTNSRPSSGNILFNSYSTKSDKEVYMNVMSDIIQELIESRKTRCPKCKTPSVGLDNLLLICKKCEFAFNVNKQRELEKEELKSDEYKARISRFRNNRNKSK